MQRARIIGYTVSLLVLMTTAVYAQPANPPVVPTTAAMGMVQGMSGHITRTITLMDGGRIEVRNADGGVIKTDTMSVLEQKAFDDWKVNPDINATPAECAPMCCDLSSAKYTVTVGDQTRTLHQQPPCTLPAAWEKLAQLFAAIRQAHDIKDY